MWTLIPTWFVFNWYIWQSWYWFDGLLNWFLIKFIIFISTNHIIINLKTFDSQYDGLEISVQMYFYISSYLFCISGLKILQNDERVEVSVGMKTQFPKLLSLFVAPMRALSFPKTNWRLCCLFFHTYLLFIYTLKYTLNSRCFGNEHFRLLGEIYKWKLYAMVWEKPKVCCVHH